jgi:hypothetical protein
VVDVLDGSLVIYAFFKLMAEEVKPTNTLKEVSTALRDLLIESGDDFQGITSSFGSTFNSPTELFTSITANDRIDLSLNANLYADARLELSFEAIAFSSTINEVSSTLMARISDTFDVSNGNFGDLHATPWVQLRLQVKNTAAPFDMTQSSNALEEFLVEGDFEATINVGMDNIPTEITLAAYSPDLTNAESLHFAVTLDIDLLPIRKGKLIIAHFCSYTRTYIQAFSVFRHQRNAQKDWRSLISNVANRYCWLFT